MELRPRPQKLEIQSSKERVESEAKGKSTGPIRVTHRPKIEALDLGPRPGGLAQELETRIDARIEKETADFNLLRQPGPAVLLDEVREHRLERDPVQRVVGFWLRHRGRRVVAALACQGGPA